MAKVMDIKGYWDMSFGNNFNDINMWEGKILLQDDGWFEGIAVDPHSSYTEDRFIFGVYYPEKVIELFKFTPTSLHAPFVYHGKRDDQGYVGQFEEICLFGTVPCGYSHIVTQDATMEKRNAEEETKALEAKIQRYKDSKMNKNGKIFYQRTIKIRKTMTLSILRSYENQAFTPMEIEELRTEFEPVSEKVLQETSKEVRKLLKQMTKDFEEEDNLPF